MLRHNVIFRASQLVSASLLQAPWSTQKKKVIGNVFICPYDKFSWLRCGWMRAKQRTGNDHLRLGNWLTIQRKSCLLYESITQEADVRKIIQQGHCVTQNSNN